MRLPGLFTVLLFFSLKVTGQADPPSAAEVMNDAFSIATKENKNVLLMFTASWCGWCHKMDKSINDISCKKIFEENYIIRHLNVDEQNEKKHLENPGAGEMKIKYYGEGQGIPYWLVFDKDGNLLSDSKIREKGEGQVGGINTGCPASEKEVAYFISILKKTSRMSEEELEVIRKRFRENDQ